MKNMGIISDSAKTWFFYSLSSSSRIPKRKKEFILYFYIHTSLWGQLLVVVPPPHSSRPRRKRVQWFLSLSCGSAAAASASSSPLRQPKNGLVLIPIRLSTWIVPSEFWFLMDLLAPLFCNRRGLVRQRLLPDPMDSRVIWDNF